MPLALYPALLFTVALLVTTAYFLLGGLPLLVLDHDTSLDARFIRGFSTSTTRRPLQPPRAPPSALRLWGAQALHWVRLPWRWRLCCSAASSSR